MKKSIFFICSVLLLMSSLVFASYVPEVGRTVPRDSKVNVSVYIPSLLLGVISGDINFKLSDKITLGPQGSYYSYGKHRGYDIGLSMNYALSGDIFGDRVWLLNPYAAYSYSDLSFDVNENGKVKNGGVVTGANLVYQWMWDCGINFRAGVGAYYSSRKPLLDIGKSHIGGTLLFSIGYAF
jgi:hypothetical protein